MKAKYGILLAVMLTLVFAGVVLSDTASADGESVTVDVTSVSNITADDATAVEGECDIILKCKEGYHFVKGTEITYTLNNISQTPEKPQGGVSHTIHLTGITDDSEVKILTATASNIYNIVVDVGEQKCYSEGGKLFEVEYGGSKDITIRPAAGYSFTAGEFAEFESSSGTPSHKIEEGEENGFTISFENVQSNITLEIASVPAVQIEYKVTLSKSTEVNCEISLDPSTPDPIHYNDEAVIRLTANAGYSFIGTTATVEIDGGEGQPVDLTGTGDYRTFSVGKITKDIKVRVTAVEMQIATYDVNIVDKTGKGLHVEGTLDPADYGSKLRIGLSALDNYYFTKGTVVKFTQYVSKDITYTVESDCHTLSFVTEPITKDVDIYVEEISEDPVRYYATVNDDGYGSYYMGKLGEDSEHPKEVERGTLYLTEDADGWLKMSVAVKVKESGVEKTKYFGTRLIQHDGVSAEYDSLIEFGLRPSLVHIENGIVTEIRAEPGASVSFTKCYADKDNVSFDGYVNETDDTVVFTSSNGIDWSDNISSLTYRAFIKETGTRYSSLRLMMDIPSTFKGNESNSCSLYLCPSSDTASVDIKVYGHVNVYENSTYLLMSDSCIGFNGTKSDSCTITVVGGSFKSVTVDPNEYITYDGKMYINSSGATYKFDISGGAVSGYVVSILSGADGITRYYSTKGAVTGSSSVLREDDELFFDKSFKESSGIELIPDVNIWSYDASSSVRTVGGNAIFKVDSGKITYITVPEKTTLIDGSGMTVTVVKKGSSPVNVEMDAAGETITGVAIGTGSQVTVPVEYGGETTIDGKTVKNSFKDYSGNGIDITINCTENDIVIEPDTAVDEETGGYVILEYGSTMTVCNADDAIAGAKDGNYNIRIFGNANTSGDRDYEMTKATFVDSDWDEFFRLLKKGVNVNGVAVDTSNPRYVHITDGELYAVKNYGYQSGTGARWIWYDLCKTFYISGYVKTQDLNLKYQKVDKATPNSSGYRNFVQVASNDWTWIRENVLPTMEILETHNGYLNVYLYEGYGKDTVIVPSKLKEAYIYDSNEVPYLRYAYNSTLEYLYYDGPTIANDSVRDCPHLKEVVCPNVTFINSTAFYNCYELEKITCPKVERTGTNVFYNCYALKGFDASEASPAAGAVTTMGSSVFYNCYALEYVYLPEITEIGSNAFRNCSKLRVADVSSAKTISSEAFRGCSQLTEIDMRSVEKIDNTCFYDCYSLGDLYLPEVNTIGNSAFSMACNSGTSGETRVYSTSSNMIRTVYAPKLTEIGTDGFSNSQYLEKIICPSLKTLKGCAFYNCISLRTFDAPELNSMNDSNSGYTFCRCESLTSFNAPNVDKIGQYCFTKCSALKDVNADNATEIWAYAFKACTSLENLYLPKLTTIKDHAFIGSTSSSGTSFTVMDSCTSLKSIYMPKVTEIGSYSFAYCEALESVVMDSVKDIKSYAFYKCTSLQSVYAPNLSGDLGEYTFTFDAAIKTVDMSSTEKSIGTYAFYNCVGLTSVNIDKASKVVSCAFQGCTNLEEVKISSCTTIESNAFKSCIALKGLDARKVTVINTSAFEGDKSLAYAYIDSVETVDSSAFYNCESLTTVTMPAVYNLGSSCFNNTAITDLDFGNDDSLYTDDKEIKIYSNAFYKCKKLTDVKIGTSEKVKVQTYIGTSSQTQIFYGCESLKNVEFGNISNITYWMFYECKALQKCTFGVVDTVNSNSFEKAGSFTLEIESVTGNIGHQNSAVTAGSGITKLTIGNVGGKIWNNAFCEADYLKTVSIGNVGEDIGNSVFSGCDRLEKATIGKVQLTIGTSLFSSCPKLVEVQIKGAEEIGASAFSGCSSLLYVNVDESEENKGVVNLEDLRTADNATSCFSGCSSITKVYLNDTTTVLPSSMFSSCTSLVEIYGKSVVYVEQYAFTQNKVLKIIDLNRSKDENVYISLYDNHAIWHTAHTVYIGGFTVTSNSGMKKTLTMENCTVKAYHTNESYRNGLNSYQNSADKSDTGFTYVYIYGNVTVGRDMFNGSSLLTELYICSTEGREFNEDVVLEDGSFANSGVKTVLLEQDVDLPYMAFRGCSSLYEIDGGQHILSIGDEAFRYDYKLKNIYDDSYYPKGTEDRSVASMPNLTSIGNDGFNLVPNWDLNSTVHYPYRVNYTDGGIIAELYAPKLESIGTAAILAYSLEKVTAGDLKEMYIQSFGRSSNLNVYYGCPNLRTFICSTYTDTIGTSESVKQLSTGMFIPSGLTLSTVVYLNTIGITGSMEVGTQFKGDEHLEALVLGDITVSEDELFANTPNLYEVTFVGDAKLGEGAFKDCKNLGSVTMIDCSPEFGKYTFSGCSSLTSFEADENCHPVVSTNMFYECTALESFNVAGLTALPSGLFSGCTSLKKINSDIEGYAVLNNVTSIGDSPFSGIVIKHMELDGMKTAVAAMFTGMTSVTYLSMNGATSIADNAFSTLVNLEELHIDSMESVTNKKINNEKNNNSVLKVVSIKGATTVEIGTFMGCTALETVHLRDDPIPTEGVVTGSVLIDEDSFRGCTSLKNVNLDWADTIGISAFRDSGITSVSLPLVSAIEEYAFYNCDGLTYVTIGGCLSYGEKCFSCDYDPEDNPTGKKSGLTEMVISTDGAMIGKYMFSNCVNLVKFYKSGECAEGEAHLDSVQSIEEGAFKGCIGFKTVYLSNTLTSIGNYSFDGCINLEKVSTAEGVDLTIGDCSFRNCGALKNLSFSTVVKIGNETFKGCYSITSLTMSKLQEMGKDSFSGCYGIVRVTMNSLEKVTTGAFSGCNSLIKVEMKKLSIIEDNAFSGCTSLKTFGGDEKVLCLPTVTKIGESAFEDCSVFESIKFGVYLTEIGKNAFRNVLYGNTKPATEIILPNSLVTIGDGAFSSSSGIGSYNVVSIPSSVTKIGENAFSARGELTIYFNGTVDQTIPVSTKLSDGSFNASGRIRIYMWNEQLDMDLSKYIKSKSTIEKYGENHAQVTMRCNDTYTCSYNSAVLLNNGYLILPYGEISSQQMGVEPHTLYFGMSSSSAAAPTLVLLNTKGDHESIAKSGDYFRPVVTYTMSEEVWLYFVGCTKSMDAGGGISIDANFESGLTTSDVPNWQFDNTKAYWYRDEVVLPTFGGTVYTKDTVYGKDSKINLKGEHAVYYPGANSITLGYIESMLLVTVAKFETTVYWVDDSTTTETKAYFGDAVTNMPVASDKMAYHFLWWSTVRGSYDEKDKVIEGETKINTIETFYYAIYEANTYYVKIDCTVPFEIAGFVVDTKTGEEYFTMSGSFKFTIDGKTGEISYTDKDHSTNTLMFSAATWQEGYVFAGYDYKTLHVDTTVTEEYNTEYLDKKSFTIDLQMVERTYSINLKFLDEDGYPLENDYIDIKDFYGTSTKTYYEVDEKTMTVENIVYRDLKENVILAVPLYDNTEDRYTYNNTAMNETYGNTKVKTNDENKLYVNYESFKNSSGERTDEITVAYYFSPGMFNIEYIYDDDAGSTYDVPTTVSEGERVKVISATDVVKTGYQFTKWVVLNTEGKIPEEEKDRVYYTPNSYMAISDVAKYADSSNTIKLQGIWEPKTVTIEFDLGQYKEKKEESITMKVNDTTVLPDGSSYNMSGWAMKGWLFVLGSEDAYESLTLTPALYGAYVDENETILMHANWLIKTYTFKVKHADPEEEETKGYPSEGRYTTDIKYQYKSSPIELWKADVIDASQQFKTLKGWQIKHPNDDSKSVTISLGEYVMSDATWQTLADIAKIQGKDEFECLQVWENKTFQFYFTTDGGGALDENTMGPFAIDDEFNVYSGDKLSKRGYTFSGWYCGTDTITIYTPSVDPTEYKYKLTSTMASMAVDGTLIFTAVWVQSSYTIDYEMNGGVPTGVIPRTAYYETQISIEYPVKSGYEFVGWSALGTTDGAQYKNGDKWSSWDGSAVLSKSFCYLSWEDSGRVTMTAVWKQTTYTINWNNLNGGSGTPSGGTESAAVGDKFTLATLLNAEKTGYTFQGWSYDNVNIYQNTSGKFNEELAAAADANNTLLMYAIWNPITYELWYNYNGNTQQQYVKISVRYDEVVNLEHLDRTGFNFDGWTSSDASTTTSKYSTTGEGDNWFNWTNPNYAANASYFKNLSSTQDAIVHMVATYTAVTYHVQYDANGGTGEVPTDVATYNVGDKFTFASYETLVGTNGEKSIIGWSTDRNATTASSITTFNETVALAADSSNTVTFYAVWVENGCLIKVDLGDATPSYIPSGWKQQADTKYYVKQVEYGSAVKEAMADWDDVTISKEGYVFTSWSYSASTAIADVIVTCNFEKVENNLLYIFLGVFVLIVVAIIVISRIER